MDAFIDVGKSGSRLHVVEHGALRAYDGQGASPTVAGNAGRVVADAVTGMLLAARATSAEHVLVGSTVELTAEERETLFEQVRRVAPHAILGVTDDGTLAHARHLHRSGVLLAVGTGVIAIARSSDGALARFDGWGPLVGDRGSAVDVGRAALREVFRDVDESRASALRARVETELGSADLALSVSILSDENWAAALANVARIVCELADEGDADAGRMLDAAADELVRTARIAGAATLGVAVTGRFGGAPAIRARLETRFGQEEIRVFDVLPPTVVRAAEILSGPYAGAIVKGGG